MRMIIRRDVKCKLRSAGRTKSEFDLLVHYFTRSLFVIFSPLLPFVLVELYVFKNIRKHRT